MMRVGMQLQLIPLAKEIILHRYTQHYREYILQQRTFFLYCRVFFWVSALLGEQYDGRAHAQDGCG